MSYEQKTTLVCAKCGEPWFGGHTCTKNKDTVASLIASLIATAAADGAQGTSPGTADVQTPSARPRVQPTPQATQPADRWPGVRVFRNGNSGGYRVVGRSDDVEWWEGTLFRGRSVYNLQKLISQDTELHDPERTAWLYVHPLPEKPAADEFPGWRPDWKRNVLGELPSAPAPSIACECSTWACEDVGGAMGLGNGHHPNCSKFVPNVGARDLLKRLVDGINWWASQEDGVPDELWEAYKKARFIVYGELLKDGEGNSVESAPAPSTPLDNPTLDGTDGAHPAWWRGHDDTTALLCEKVNQILDGKDDGSGVANDPWEKVRRRLLAIAKPADPADDEALKALGDAHTKLCAERDAIRAELDAAKKDRDKWKANHDEMVSRNKLLRNRPDLPLDRVSGYDELAKELDEAKAIQADALKLAEAARDLKLMGWVKWRALYAPHLDVNRWQFDTGLVDLAQPVLAKLKLRTREVVEAECQAAKDAVGLAIEEGDAHGTLKIKWKNWMALRAELEALKGGGK